MRDAHGYVWECRAPSHTPLIFEQEAEFLDHACEKHGVPDVHLATVSSAARRLGPEKILECPFGDDFVPSVKDESNSVFSNESLLLHVASHMKEIALLALQKLPSDDDNESEDVASDVMLKDDGVTKLRASMYSVLDDENLQYLDEPKDGVSNILQRELTSLADKVNLANKDAARSIPPQIEMDDGYIALEIFDKKFDTMVDQSLLTVPVSDGHSEGSHDAAEGIQLNGGRGVGLRRPEEAMQNVRQVRKIGACVRCRILKIKVRLNLTDGYHMSSGSDSSSARAGFPALLVQS